MSLTTTLPEANSHFISLDDAIGMTAAYRNARETILDTSFRSQNILPYSETFNRNAFDALLAIDACAGIRIYYGMDDNSRVHAVIVGVNEDNEDILPLSSTIITNYIVEEGQRCPDLCVPASGLNES